MNSVFGPAAPRCAVAKRLTRSPPGTPGESAGIVRREKNLSTSVRLGVSVGHGDVKDGRLRRRRVRACMSAARAE